MIEFEYYLYLWYYEQHGSILYTWSIPYLCVKRPATNVTAAAATINPKSKDRYHILYRRWYYTANVNAISTYSSIRKECSTRSLDVMKMDTLSYVGVSEVKKFEVEVAQIEVANTRNTYIIIISLPQSPYCYWWERLVPLHDKKSSWYACCLLLIVLVSFVDSFPC